MVEAVFLRLLGLVYLISFASLWPQMVGLVGSNGISPVAVTLKAMRADYGWHAFLFTPSLFWFAPKDATLLAICALGCAAALFLIFGVATRAAAIAAYVLYLSIVAVGQPFTSFQWDSLLLETGFLAIFAGSEWLALAFRFLLFRLMFEAGLVKLTSGDPNWRNLHALRYHFFTQPLPNPLSYYMQQAPTWLLDSLTLMTLAIELAAPFMIFAYPKRVRQAAVVLLVGLQAVIAATGNFAFFNLLTIFLCIWALDDDCLGRMARLPLRQLPSPKFRKVLDGCVISLIGLSVLQIFGLSPSFLESFEIVNPYGLFAVMTTERTELIIEGSNDGIEWQSYSFRYKPGDVYRGLPIVAPYQPRLDWQMWFAALGSPENNLWATTLVYRLLVGEPSVLQLMDRPPFAKPPRSIRISAYSYTFTRLDQRRESGAVWQRKVLGIWFGPVSLDAVKKRLYRF